MSDEKHVTDPELSAALRCCGTVGGCKVCPMNSSEDDGCGEKVCLLGAERIVVLHRELARMRTATEGICQQMEAEMVEAAQEANVALDRGLVAVNKAHIGELLERQKLLTELGRGSVVRTEPAEPDGWLVLAVTIEERCVFGAGEIGELRVGSEDIFNLNSTLSTLQSPI